MIQTDHFIRFEHVSSVEQTERGLLAQVHREQLRIDLVRDDVVRLHAVEDGGLKPEPAVAAVVLRAHAARHQLGALGAALLHVAEHAVELLLRDERAEARLRIQRIARLRKVRQRARGGLRYVGESAEADGEQCEHHEARGLHGQAFAGEKVERYGGERQRPDGVKIRRIHASA